MIHNVSKEFEEMYRYVEHEQHRYDHYSNQDGEIIVARVADGVKRDDTIDDKHECNGSDPEELNKKIQREERNQVEDVMKFPKTKTNNSFIPNELNSTNST